MELLEEYFRADGSKSFTHYLNDAIRFDVGREQRFFNGYY
jgi:hypothetical protein